MLRLPVWMFYAMLALNITGFTLFLQLDMLIFNAVIYKIFFWILTIGAWSMVYIKRNKFVTLF